MAELQSDISNQMPAGRPCSDTYIRRKHVFIRYCGKGFAAKHVCLVPKHTVSWLPTTERTSIDATPASAAMAIATTTAHARVIMQGSEPPEFDCNQGCPATTSPVCAEGDITLQGACLAYCQKLTVKHTGPCDVVDGHGRVSGTDAVVGE